MALTTRHKPVKTLQGAFPRGTPFDSRQLRKIGVSSALAHHYLKSDWLARLGRDVFMFPKDTLRQEDSLKFLSRAVEGFHVGGKTALAWRGIRHNLPTREPLSLLGDGKAVLPPWFTERFPARYTARNLFSQKLSNRFGLHPLPETSDGVLVWMTLNQFPSTHEENAPMSVFKTAWAVLASCVYAAGISARAAIKTRRGIRMTRSFGPTPGPGGMAEMASSVMSWPTPAKSPSANSSICGQ